MKRTRRWEFVKQDAIRFAGLGLNDAEIARRLDLDRATVGRWRKAGKLGMVGQTVPRAPLVMPRAAETPAQWAASVRATYDLDPTDDQMVTMAESTLLVARDPSASASLRLQAMGRFQALVKQLALVARRDPAGQPTEEPKRQTFEVQRRSGGDPRNVLQAVK